MTEHTPGPWTIEGGYNLLGPYDSIRISSPSTERRNAVTVAHAIGGIDPAERLANAYILAAAPQLLEALEAVENSPIGGSGQTLINGDVWKQIRSAIATARGETSD